MSGKTFQNKRRWAVDLSARKPDRGVDSLPAPPGYMASVSQVVQADAAKPSDNSLVIKKAWDLAISPLKNVPMNLFLMYMAGNVIGIFPIMMVGMALLRPVKALFATNDTFKVIEGTHATLQKAIYLLGNLVNVAIGLYKCQSLGILPTHASDWLAFQDPIKQMEYAYGGLMLS